MRKPLDGSVVFTMVLLCGLWGLQQVVIKAAAADIPTLFQVTLRSGIAASLVYVYSRFVARDRWLTEGMRRPALLVALLFAIEFFCIAEGLRFTSASHMSVFLYTGPLFAALGLHVGRPEERLSLPQWLGMGLAFGGIAFTFLGPGAGELSRTVLVGDLFGLGAGAAWGFTTVAIRVSRLSEAPATQTLFYQLAGGFVLLLPFAFFTQRIAFEPTPIAIASLLFQGVLVSFVSYLIWFGLLRTYLASRLGVLSFMSPLFGVVMGAVILGERPAPSFVMGAGLVIAGLVVVNVAPKAAAKA